MLVSYSQAEALNLPVGHPRDKVVYVGDPASPTVYYPAVAREHERARKLGARPSAQRVYRTGEARGSTSGGWCYRGHRSTPSARRLHRTNKVLLGVRSVIADDLEFRVAG
jgi:hypothetical protein